MSKLDNSIGDFESLGTQLPYEVEDKTDGFHFIGTVHVTRRLAQNTYQAFIRKEQTGVLHSEREGLKRGLGKTILELMPLELKERTERRRYPRKERKLQLCKDGLF